MSKRLSDESRQILEMVALRTAYMAGCVYVKSDELEEMLGLLQEVVKKESEGTNE